MLMIIRLFKIIAIVTLFVGCDNKRHTDNQGVDMDMIEPDKNGNYVTYHENGNLKEKGFYFQGKKDGNCLSPLIIGRFFQISLEDFAYYLPAQS